MPVWIVENNIPSAACLLYVGSGAEDRREWLFTTCHSEFFAQSKKVSNTLRALPDRPTDHCAFRLASSRTNPRDSLIFYGFTLHFGKVKINRIFHTEDKSPTTLTHE
jgi:hypothetical protein